MPRTTVDIDAPVLQELKRMQHREKKSLGRLVSDLLAEALAARRAGQIVEEAPFEWVSRPMGARVDLTDKEALHRLLDEEDEGEGG
jgi:hypothetical protein